MNELRTCVLFLNPWYRPLDTIIYENFLRLFFSFVDKKENRPIPQKYEEKLIEFQEEIWILILSELTLEDLKNIASADKMFATIIRTSQPLWRLLFYRDRLTDEETKKNEKYRHNEKQNYLFRTRLRNELKSHIKEFTPNFWKIIYVYRFKESQKKYCTTCEIIAIYREVGTDKFLCSKNCQHWWFQNSRDDNYNNY